MKRLSISKAWDEASGFLGREARLVAPIALALLALPSVVANWASPQGGGSAGGMLNLIALICSFIGQMAIAALALGWKGSLGEAIGKAAKRVWVVVAAALMLFLPLSIVAVVALGSALTGAGITDPAAVTPETIGKVPGILPIALLLLAALLFLGVKLVPMTPVAISEPVGPVQLIRRCWSLTRGHFWRLFALLLLLLLVAVILSGAVVSVVGTVAALGFGEARAFNLTALLTALANGLVAALVGSVSAAIVGRVYAQLVHQPTVPEVHHEPQD